MAACHFLREMQEKFLKCLGKDESRAGGRRQLPKALRVHKSGSPLIYVLVCRGYRIPCLNCSSFDLKYSPLRKWPRRDSVEESSVAGFSRAVNWNGVGVFQLEINRFANGDCHGDTPANVKKILQEKRESDG